MFEVQMTTAELLEQWREATRAAELAEGLAKMAAESQRRTAAGAAAAEELAGLAERAAAAATEAATTARKAANDAVAAARDTVADRGRDDDTLTAALIEEDVARGRYHDAEREARDRHSD